MLLPTDGVAGGGGLFWKNNDADDPYLLELALAWRFVTLTPVTCESITNFTWESFPRDAKKSVTAPCYHTSLAGAGGAVNNKLTNTNKRTKTDAATTGGGRCSTMAAAAAAAAGEGARNTPTFVHTAIPAATTTMTTIMAGGATTPTTISSNGRYVSKRCDYNSMCVREMCVNCRVCVRACVRAWMMTSTGGR